MLIRHIRFKKLTYSLKIIQYDFSDFHTKNHIQNLISLFYEFDKNAFFRKKVDL